jgi:hypothetical protein
MTLYDILCLSAEKALTLQGKDGTMPAGHNGPYHHEDTPLRATSHWAILFLKVWEITGQERFREAAIKCCDHLISPEARPYGMGFQCKVNRANGLISPSWVMEALGIAATKLGVEKYRDVAVEVFSLTPFEWESGHWGAIHADGTPQPLQEIFYEPENMVIHITDTFNHVLWFALAGLMLATPEHDEVTAKVDCFLGKIPSYFKVYDNGCICHRMYWEHKNTQEDPAMAHKEIPYHCFSLYAYGVIRQFRPDLAIFEEDGFKSALRFVCSEEHYEGLLDTRHEGAISGAAAMQDSLSHNRFGFAYNVIGFLTAFVLHAFRDFYDFDVSDSMQQWCSEQVRRCFDFETGLMGRDTEDPALLAARIYEATRLPDLELHGVG